MSPRLVLEVQGSGQGLEPCRIGLRDGCGTGTHRRSGASRKRKGSSKQSTETIRSMAAFASSTTDNQGCSVADLSWHRRSRRKGRCRRSEPETPRRRRSPRNQSPNRRHARMPWPAKSRQGITSSGLRSQQIAHHTFRPGESHAGEPITHLSC